MFVRCPDDAVLCVAMRGCGLVPCFVAEGYQGGLGRLVGGGGCASAGLLGCLMAASAVGRGCRA